MLRGMTTFKCHDCGHTFRGPDIEYMATVLTAPQKCPKCGSMHTCPGGALKSIYKTIWDFIDKNNSK